MSHQWRSAWGTIAVGVALTLGCDQELPQARAQAVGSLAAPQAPLPAQRGDSSYTEYVLVFISASWCGACEQSTLPPALRSLSDRLAAAAASAGARVRRIGVFLEHDPLDGFASSKRFGQFDDLVLGGGWSGQGAVSFVWRDLAGEARVPQVLILRRTVTVGPAGFVFGDDDLVSRLIGIKAIGDEELRRLGAPGLPD